MWSLWKMLRGTGYQQAHSSQLMAKCMCDAGAGRRVEQKKSRPGRRAVPQGGPLGLDRSSTAFVRSSRKIYPLVSQILEDLGRRNPWRAWLGDHKRGDLPGTSIPDDHKSLSGWEKYTWCTHKSSQLEGESGEQTGLINGPKGGQHPALKIYRKVSNIWMWRP